MHQRQRPPRVWRQLASGGIVPCAWTSSPAATVLEHLEELGRPLVRFTTMREA